jgi:hypothetical protein
MGLFGIFSEQLDKTLEPGQAKPVWHSFVAGFSAGAMGALVGNPADLTLIRMQVRALVGRHQASESLCFSSSAASDTRGVVAAVFSRRRCWIPLASARASGHAARVDAARTGEQRTGSGALPPLHVAERLSCYGSLASVQCTLTLTAGGVRAGRRGGGAQADSGLPLDQRRNYKNVFDALFRIAREEGFMGLFAGATPTVVRAAVLNTGAAACGPSGLRVNGCSVRPLRSLRFKGR